MAKNESGSEMDVGRVLQGMEFPATKQGIISYAKQKNAPQELMNALNGLPDREYADMDELTREVEARMGQGEEE